MTGFFNFQNCKTCFVWCCSAFTALKCVPDIVLSLPFNTRYKAVRLAEISGIHIAGWHTMILACKHWQEIFHFRRKLLMLWEEDGNISLLPSNFPNPITFMHATWQWQRAYLLSLSSEYFCCFRWINWHHNSLFPVLFLIEDLPSLQSGDFFFI